MSDIKYFSRYFIKRKVEYNKDLLYMLFLGLQLSSFEIRQFLGKLYTLGKWDMFGGFSSTRDIEILKIINDINIFKSVDNYGSYTVEIFNRLLNEKGFPPLNPQIKEKVDSKSNVKTILLIGGFGFIGRRCVDCFKNSMDGVNYRICVLAKDNPKTLPDNIICYQGDITNKLVYERILSENQVDYIINLAAISTIARGADDFSQTTMIKAQAPNALRSAILENKFLVKCVIFPSTIQVYSGIVDENAEKYFETLMINANKI